MASSSSLVAGIAQNTVKTDRLEIAYLEAGIGSTPVVLVHGNTSSSLFYQDFMLGNWEPFPDGQGQMSIQHNR